VTKGYSIIGLWLVQLTLGLVLAGAALADNTAARNPKWAQAVALPESENFYRVTPDLYRAAQPTAAAFKEYERFGIKTVINLRASHSDRKLLTGSTLKLVEVPIKTWDIDDEEVVAVLRLIRDEPKPILVHCQHGADRTGTIIAMYRMVNEGWSRDEALDELRGGGYGFHRIWKNIPKYLKEVNVDKIKSQVSR